MEPSFILMIQSFMGDEKRILEMLNIVLERMAQCLPQAKQVFLWHDIGRILGRIFDEHGVHLTTNESGGFKIFQSLRRFRPYAAS